MAGDDAVAALLDEAAETLRAVSHDRTRPAHPAALSERVAALADVLRKLDQVTGRLGVEAGAQLRAGGLRVDEMAAEPAEVVARGLQDALQLVRSHVAQAGVAADLAHNRAARLAVDES